MYEVIDLSKEIAFFQDSECSKLHDKLKDLYANMCATVHTATKNNMQNVSAIGYFPHFEITKAMEVKKKYVDTVSTMLIILCLMFNDVFHNMHYKNKDIVLLSVDKKSSAKLHLST